MPKLRSGNSADEQQSEILPGVQTKSRAGAGKRERQSFAGVQTSY